MVDDILAAVPNKGEEHTDGTDWDTTDTDPDAVISAGLLQPDCTGSQDTCVSGNAIPVWVVDKNGVVFSNLLGGEF